MTSPTHGMLESRLAGLLGLYLESHPTGKVLTNTGFILRRNPDVTRAPDVAFVSLATIAAHPVPERGFWSAAPDLAVEIVSPEDRADAINDKVGEYLEAGVRLVWVVYPRQRNVHVFKRGNSEVVIESRSLSGEEVAPRFELPLARLWSVLD
jgi:Uma2 family endonuclease